MARVDSTQVKNIIDTNRDVDIHIDTAAVIVDENLKGQVSNDDLLARIELYLAAHFTALTEEKGGLTESQVESARERYADVYEAGFRSTRFGQQAIALDPTGKLASMATNKLKAMFRVV